MHGDEVFAEERGEAWKAFLGDLDGLFHLRFRPINWANRYRDFNMYLRRRGRGHLSIPWAWHPELTMTEQRIHFGAITRKPKSK